MGSSKVKNQVVLDVEVEPIYNFSFFDFSTSSSMNLEAEQPKSKVYIREAYFILVPHLDISVIIPTLSSVGAIAN